jgi:hypothetical protein
MTDMVFWIGVGALIGWNIPAPFWATWVWEKVKSMVMPK